MKRSKHNLSHYNLTTFDQGKLIPVGCIEVLPGDTIQHATSMLIRLSPLAAPVMHPMTVRIHHFFVPYRLLWNGWEEFITGGPDGLGGSSGAVPIINPPFFNASQNLLHYLGIHPDTTSAVIAFPVSAYNLIWNEFYRDQDLQAEVPTTNQSILPIAWEKDYFTTARPWPQRGNAVTIPLGVTAPVVGTGDPIKLTDGTGEDTLTRDNPWLLTSGGNIPAFTPNLAFGASPGLETDLTNATAASITDLRKAFALQRYAEARAVYGARYTEYLRYLGVKSSDARLRRPEYLGGGKQTISVSEVLQTEATPSPTTSNYGVGDMKGHGIAALRSGAYRRFFEEHGVVLSLASIRPKAMYTNGLHRMWSRRTKEDYWQAELERIGQQEVKAREVYHAPANPDATFGYSDRYAEYRTQPSFVSGEFRNVMSDWHLGRMFGAEPVLNASFIECEPSKRIHAVQTNDTIWSMSSHKIVARRLVGNNTAPRIY